MSGAPRVLAFAGSARADSYNRKLVRVAAAGAEASGARCTLLELRDLPLPSYDGSRRLARRVGETLVRWLQRAV